ncbi:MAG: ATP-dependent protease ATPase subunit HslU [Fimbriimonadaceae bacterium]
MNQKIESLTPRQIVRELDRYIVGQDQAKRAVAVALRNRFRRQKLSEEDRQDVIPKNILMIGPTGVGKTEIARRLAQLAQAPFVKVEATKFTEVGYVGRDVDSIIRDLLSEALRLVEREKLAEVREVADAEAEKRLLDLIEWKRLSDIGFSEGSNAGNMFMQALTGMGFQNSEDENSQNSEEEMQREQQRASVRGDLEQQYRAGELEDELIEIEVEAPHNPFVQVFSNQGIQEMGMDMFGQGGTRRATRKVTVAEARRILADQEAEKLVDRGGIEREAVDRAEQTGIVFIDEIDKVAGKSGGAGPDVSREGVQRDLLPIIEGSTVVTKHGPVRTDHVLFIAAGAFHISEPSDLIPELQGRLPIRVELTALGQNDFQRILTEPKNSLVRQYQLLLRADGVEIEFTEDAVQAVANEAAAQNELQEDIGARRLHTVMESMLHEILFDAPDTDQKKITIDRKWVENALDI